MRSSAPAGVKARTSGCFSRAAVDLCAIPAYAKNRILKGAQHLGGLTFLEQPSLEEQPHTVAARRLVHVRRCEDDGHPLGEEVVQEVPELAAAHRIDAVGRLVEQSTLGS